MAIVGNVPVRNRIADALVAAFGASAVLEIRSGVRPTNGADAASGTILWSFTFDATPWGTTSAGGNAQADVPLEANASATGTAGHFRLRNSGSSEWIYGTVTATGGGGDIELASTSLTSGQPVRITSLTIGTAAWAS